jgi:hypothetical protein
MFLACSGMRKNIGLSNDAANFISKAARLSPRTCKVSDRCQFLRRDRPGTGDNRKQAQAPKATDGTRCGGLKHDVGKPAAGFHIGMWYSSMNLDLYSPSAESMQIAAPGLGCTQANSPLLAVRRTRARSQSERELGSLE